MSGDTVVLTSVTPGEGDKEKVLSLAYVTAPRMRKEGDEPNAWNSRNHLLLALVGKVVCFKVLYEIPSIKREFGFLWNDDDEYYPHEAIRAGWLQVREGAGRSDDSEESKRLLNDFKILESEARAERLGLWSGDDGIIEVENDIGNPTEFMKKFKGKIVKSQVEAVLTGDRIRLRIWASEKKHYQVVALIAGIKAPATARTHPETKETLPAEPFGDEAKLFVEKRLLQRRVDFKVTGLSPQNHVVGILKHPKGDIGVLLTAAGLARAFDHHSTMVGPYMARIRDAERYAKEHKNGQFVNYVAPKQKDAAAIPVTVVRVFSADTVFVRNQTGVAEKRIALSSIRGPRRNEPAEAPFQDAAKEFLRKKVIGKQVRMIIDGVKPANGEYEEKEVATLLLNDTNLNLLLVQEGWASVIRHRKDDTDRAPNYDDLLAAQDIAKAEKRGMWSPKAPSVKSYVDASETVTKAKMNLAGLQRHRKLPAIVDYVKSGSRFTVLVPSEGVKLNFVLGGIRAPKSARNATEQGEPFGQEAHEFANRHLAQRDVEISVHNIDKVGGFIGEIFVNRVSFAKLLVEEGLATVHEYSAEQSGNAAELLPAQQRAKEAHKNMWKDWTPVQDEEEADAASSNWASNDNDAAEKQTVQENLRHVTVTNVDADGKLKIQIEGAGLSALSSMISQFRNFNLSGSNNVGLPSDPKNGDFVSAKFSGDGEWYRGRIRANDRAAKEAEVQFIDFGNREKIPWSKLRPLAPQFSVQKLKAQAEDAVFSCIQMPSAAEYCQQTIEDINNYTVGKKLLANIDFVDRDGTNYITLYETEDKDLMQTTNVQLVGMGLAIVKRNLRGWEVSAKELVEELTEAEENAKSKRAGMWQYGDITED